MIHQIDLGFQREPDAISAFLVEGESGLAIVEPGPGSCTEALRQGIRDCGFDEEEVTDVLVTHVHLDHAGGAGWWAARGATVYVHPRGGRHLIDPSRLWESAAQIYGDRMSSLWGEMLPIPEEQVIAVPDQDPFTLRCGREFIAYDTPGHARHHHVFKLVDGGELFTGDVAGVRLGEAEYVSPATAPPQFDLDAYRSSIDLLISMDPKTLFLTHGGRIDGEDRVNAHLRLTREAVEQAAEFVRLRLLEGLDAESLQVAYQAFQMELAFQAGVPSELWTRYETANPCGMCADGLRYLFQ